MVQSKSIPLSPRALACMVLVTRSDVNSTSAIYLSVQTLQSGLTFVTLVLI